jgi:hypothetical protein
MLRVLEKRINKKIESYMCGLKEKVKEKASELGLSVDKEVSNIVQYIYDYENIMLTKEDFQKRKRVKNVVHLSDRCCSKRANGEQCTRRRKDENTEFCGTHLKGTPHGVCDIEEDKKPQGHKIEVWIQDIQGIVYYIDKGFNVYQPEDIVSGKVNPKVIAKYVKVGDLYSIPEFNI